MPGGFDTVVGGGDAQFPASSWSVIADVAKPGEERYQKAWTRLCSLYWKPVYTYVRRRWMRGSEDAKDLTQQFFLHLYESDAIRTYRRDKAHFRTFLKSVLKNFLIDQDRRAGAEKRGGKTQRFSMEAAEPELEAGIEATTEMSPDDAFDRQWAMELLERGLEKVREKLTKEGRQVQYEVYRRCVLEPPDGVPPPRKQVALELGLTEPQVHNYLADVRALVRSTLLEEVRDYTTSPEEAMGELRELLGL